MEQCRWSCCNEGVEIWCWRLGFFVFVVISDVSCISETFVDVWSVEIRDSPAIVFLGVSEVS